MAGPIAVFIQRVRAPGNPREGGIRNLMTRCPRLQPFEYGLVFFFFLEPGLPHLLKSITLYLLIFYGIDVTENGYHFDVNNKHVHASDTRMR